jgi:hypothetical protein
VSIETQSKISLLSKALILCGEKPLESLSDDRYGATVGSNLFEVIYEAEIQSNRWRFSMKKGALSRLVATPLNEWQYCYQLPTDMLLLVGMTCPQPYEIYGEHLYTDATTVEIEYQFKPTIDKLPAYFSLLMCYVLAKDCVVPITENEARIRVMESKYQVQRNRALFADAQSRPSRPIYSSPFTDVR